MNNIESIETDSFSSSDDLPSLSRPKTSTPNANNNGQQTGQSATCMTTDDDQESTMQLVIEVVYHHNDKTYREWYPNNTKADVSVKTLNLLWHEVFQQRHKLYIYFLIQILLKYISEKLDNHVLLQCGEKFINPDDRLMELTSGSTLHVFAVIVQK